MNDGVINGYGKKTVNSTGNLRTGLGPMQTIRNQTSMGKAIVLTWSYLHKLPSKGNLVIRPISKRACDTVDYH